MTSFASTLHLSNNVKSIKSLRDFRFSRNGKCFPIAPDQCGQYAHYQTFSSSKTELALSEKTLTCRDLLDNKNKENLKIKMSLHIEQPKKTRPKFKESALKVNTYSLLICTWVLKNRVRPTGFLASKNQFWNWFLQATQYSNTGCEVFRRGVQN